MGEYKGKLSQISRDYDLWIVVVSNEYETTASKVVDDLFKRLANNIGPKAMISEMQSDGVAEAEQKFGISIDEPRPVLVITQKHPSDWKEGDEAIKIPLGKFKNSDDLRNFLSLLAKLVRQKDFGGAKWQWRKKRISDIAKSYGPVVVGLIPAL